MDENSRDQGERSLKTRALETCRWIKEKSGPARTKGLALLRQTGRFLWRICRKAGALAVAISRFYWAAGPDLGKYVAEHARTRSDGSSAHQIRLTTLGDYKYAEWDGKCWDVSLPDCCAACGITVSGDREDEVRRVPNLFWPLWAPVIGLAGGVVLALFFWTKWVLPLAILAGFTAGYLLRKETEIRLRYLRCQKHAANRQFPDVRIMGNLLSVFVGQHSVKIDFLARERGTVTSHAAPTPPTVPDSIPLDEDPQATVAPSFPECPEPSPPAGMPGGLATTQQTPAQQEVTGPAVEEIDSAAGPLDPAPQEPVSASPVDEVEHAAPRDVSQQPAPVSAAEGDEAVADENSVQQPSRDSQLDEYALAPEAESSSPGESGDGLAAAAPSDPVEAGLVHDRSLLPSESRRDKKATRTSRFRRPVGIVAITGLVLLAAGFAARRVYVAVRRAYAPEIPVLILEGNEGWVLWHEKSKRPNSEDVTHTNVWKRPDSSVFRSSEYRGGAYVTRQRCADLGNEESVAVCVVVVDSKDQLKEPYLICDRGDRWESEASIHFQEFPVLLNVPRSQFLWPCEFSLPRQPEIFGCNGEIYRCRLVDKPEFWNCLTDCWKREVLARNEGKPESERAPALPNK
jgi:hypothetical protein